MPEGDLPPETGMLNMTWRTVWPASLMAGGKRITDDRSLPACSCTAWPFIDTPH